MKFSTGRKVYILNFLPFSPLESPLEVLMSQSLWSFRVKVGFIASKITAKEYGYKLEGLYAS